MSSQLPMGEVPATQVPGTETTRGRVCWPSEKVQAMLEKHEHSKRASTQQA
ncbi:hypothetical protein OG21DRAFT_1491880 [Imleria badia]|nr:hypothetical protein OG21DRAFT_1491880 [Imleria badia]